MATASEVNFGEGDHIRLARPVERFPHFTAPKGATGTVVEVSDTLIRIRMDEKINGAEEWDNEVCWSVADGDTPGLDVEVITTATPQDAFHEAANLAKGYFAAADAIEGFAEAFDYKLWNAGGGNMVALKYVDDRHVISVDPEFTCLFETEKSGNCAEGLFQMAEDPWLITGNLDEEVV